MSKDKDGIRSSSLVRYFSTIDAHQNPKTGLVHGAVKREFTVSNRPLPMVVPNLSFTLQCPNESQKVVLMAEKKSPHNYHLYEPTNNEVIGSLQRCHSNFSYILYGLFNIDGEQIAAIWYKVHSIVNILSEATPRKAQLAFHIPKRSKLDGGMSQEDRSTQKWFENHCKESIRMIGSLHAVVAGEQTPCVQNVYCYDSKTCHAKSSGRVGLNFKGRGRIASTKNIQLLSDDGSIVCQMAKWDDNTFNVDFKYPVNILYAFAFAIAQLDL
jgi:Tub family